MRAFTQIRLIASFHCRKAYRLFAILRVKQLYIKKNKYCYEVIMAIIYLRASSNEIDLSNQKEIIKELLPRKKSFFTKDIYIEEISSDFEKSRFNLEIINGNYKNETIYVLSIDRVCRDIEVLENILDSLQQKNIQIFCLKLNKYFTKDDIIIRKLFQQYLKLEKEYFSAVTKKSLDNLKKQGIQLGKRRKYDFNEYFKIISEAKEIKNMTYRDIGKMLNIDPATAYRIYLKGNEEGAYRSDKRPELKEMIKRDLAQGDAVKAKTDTAPMSLVAVFFSFLL